MPRLSKFSLTFAGLTILSLVALSRPMVTKTLVDRDRTRCLESCNVIADALRNYVRDTGLQPTGYRGGASYAWLQSPGVSPRFEHFPDGQSGQLDWFVAESRMAGNAKWMGPYLDEVPRDPWGHAFTVWLGGPIGDTKGPLSGHVWVISGGPDGVVQTDLATPFPLGDDVGMLLD